MTVTAAMRDGVVSLHVYHVTYSGSYLGGTAIVIAESEAEARRLVETHSSTCNFVSVDVEDMGEPKTGVFHNWNGDY